MKFYSRYNGSRFIMPKGKVCTFHGGVYETEDKDEIRELMLAAKGSPDAVSQTPLDVVKSDAVVMKDVGSKAKAGTGVGTVNSATLGQLKADSQ